MEKKALARPSLRASIDAKCRDCGGQDGGDRCWRQHVSVCPVTHCQLWQVRPLATRNVPEWLASSDADDLPKGFLELATEDAIGVIRGPAVVVPAKTAGNSVTNQDQGNEGACHEHAT
jgi:hypothetical protein